MAAKNITAFSFTSPPATGTIRGTAISVTVPIATDVTALAATFTHTGASIAVGAVAQVSGTTINDFSGDVTYTVTASDATTQDYTVTVTVSQVTAADIAELRRMVMELTTTTYSDVLLTSIIERYACVDENGESPRVQSWIGTYDLHSAAAAIWQEKAASVAAKFDFNADGGNYIRSQIFEQYMKQARFHLARRNPKTIVMVPELA